jgi:DNA polymerase-3 subunit alpha
MTHAPFVHLRVHSAYSLSEGAIKAEKIPQLARDGGMPAVAITDTGNLFGALEFSQACAAKGVQPILGCQVAITRAENGRLAPDPVVLLAQDAAGLANLQRLSSRGFLDGDPACPQVPLGVLLDHAAGVFLLTGGTRGPLARLLAEGRKPDAETLLAQLAEAFPGRAAVELHRHGLAVERQVEPGLIALADAAGLPLVATNECFFAAPSMHEAHDALLCIAEGRTVAEPERRRVTPEHWFKPAAAMRALFKDLGDACDNTVAIARTCAVMAETRKPLLPVCPKVGENETEEARLRAMAAAGLARRMDAIGADGETRARYEARLAYELDVIAGMGFPGYFLIVADFIQWAKAQGIPVGPGRGSGAGSVAAWALQITDLDPLRWNLLFERFLNPERVSMPDFDVDFCPERRDEVIDYVRRAYGADRVAQIITFGKLQARAAVRDVGRVLGLPFGQVNRVAELIPNNPAKPVTLGQAIDGEPRLQAMREEDESIRRLMEVALQLEGLYRHASTHAAGVVIGDRPLLDLVPLYRDPKADTLVTQYSMKHVEQAGLVKFDFLGLTTLTILQRTLKLLADAGTPVDLERIPLDDAKTFEMLRQGDTGAVFQFEGTGMRDVLRLMRADRFEDLIAAVALYRPGPMAMIPEYCRRKHGGAWQPMHASIADILDETYGVIVYQEQVMQIAQRMAGYSLGGADMLRRAMGKKIRAEMDAQRQIFLDGAKARGIADAKAVEVFDAMAKFADYGFNKSHSAPYALVSYQTAWLKANHGAAFFAACMSCAIGNTDKLALLRQSAEQAGIPVLPPCINRSAADFTVEAMPDGRQAIRYALAAVKKVGFAAMEALVAARDGQPFRDAADLAARADPRQLNKLALENLVRAGALDAVDRNRARLCASADLVLKRAQGAFEERATGQSGLFGGAKRPEPLRLPDVPEWPEMDRLTYEADAIGFFLSAHPLDSYRPALKRLGVVPSRDIEARARAGGGRVKLAGIVGDVKLRNTSKGTRMAWVRLSDQAGSYEVTFFQEALTRAGDMLKAGAALLVDADLRADGEGVRVTANSVEALDAAAGRGAGGLRVWLERADAVPGIRDILGREGRGRGKVTLLPVLGAGGPVAVELPGAWQVGPRLAQALKALPGVQRVEEG